MKTSFTLSAVMLISIIASNLAFADAWVQNNTVCNWFTKRYKAHVGIKKAGALSDYCSQTERDCYNIEIECNKAICQDYFCGYYARAYAQINDQGSNIIEYGGFDGDDYWYAGYDVSFKKPVQTYYPMIFYRKSKERFTETQCSVKKTQFDFKSHSIILHNITGTINLQTNDLVNDFASIVISLTKKSNSDDELRDDIYLKNLIYSSKIFVNNGVLKLKGLIKKDMILTKSVDKLTYISFSIPTLVISVPADINLDDVSLNIGVDSGNLGFGISDKFAIENDAESYVISEEITTPNEQLTIKNYPNPAESNHISIDFQLSESENVEVLLYDNNGNVLDTLFKGYVEKGQTKTINDINISKVHITGYIKIVTPQKIVMKKISKL